MFLPQSPSVYAHLLGDKLEKTTVLDRDGNVAAPFNTSGMYRGWIKPDGSRGTAIFRDDE